MNVKVNYPRIRQQMSGEIVPVHQFSQEGGQMKKFLSSRSLNNHRNPQMDPQFTESQLEMMNNIRLEEFSETSPLDASHDNEPKVSVPISRGRMDSLEGIRLTQDSQETEHVV